MGEKSQGKIPEPSDITAIGNAYGEIGSEIVVALLDLTPLNFSEIRAVKTKKKTDSLIRELNQVAVKHTKNFMPDAYHTAQGDSVVALQALGKKPLPVFDDKIHKQTILEDTLNADREYITSNATINITVNTWINLVRNVSGRLLQVRETIAGLAAEEEAFLLGLIDSLEEAGVPRIGVSNQITKFLQKTIADEKLIVIDGRRYNLKAYSKMVARTEMRNSQSNAVINSCNEYGNDLVEVSDHGSITPFCIPFQGNTYSISGTSKVYPQLTETPSFHPNCQHFLMPTSEEAISFQQQFEQQTTFSPQF